MNDMKVKLYTDGAARGNPGPAGIGAVIKDDGGRLVREIYKYLGEATNNQAEYVALIEGLKGSLKYGAKEVEVFADSELMVRQLNGEYRVKNQGLKPLYKEVVELLQKFNKYTISHVRREFNKEADSLANKAIDFKDL